MSGILGMVFKMLGVIIVLAGVVYAASGGVSVERLPAGILIGTGGFMLIGLGEVITILDGIRAGNRPH